MEPLIHFVVPFVTLTALGIDPWMAVLFSCLALTPDLDVLFRVHRSMSHSLVPLLLVSVPLLALTWGNGDAGNFILMASLSVASHILLDLTGYTPVLYPLIRDSFRLKVDVGIHFGSAPRFRFDLDFLSRPTRFTYFESLDAPLFTGQGLMISLLLLTPILLDLMRRWVVRLFF